MAQREDLRYMRQALRLAQRGEGHTRPNPPVGAVVVRNTTVIGAGFHTRAGAPHAEIEALNRCAGHANGATLYVTLEPCSTFGRTPPCTERIIKEKIARVVIGCLDPNPKHAGRGVTRLREAGIEVTLDVESTDAKALIAPFAKHILTGLPFVTLKLAMTLDGRIADRTGASKWITGERARAEVQRMRKAADILLIGAGTVCADNPSLLYRGKNGGSLMRVVVDTKGITPPTAQVYTDAAAPQTIVATTTETAARMRNAWEHYGAHVWTFPRLRSGHLSLRSVLKRLGEEGYLHVLCEGGGHLAGALHDADLVDEYVLFYAPVFLGDARGKSGISGNGVLMKDLQRRNVAEVRRMGDDLMLRIQ